MFESQGELVEIVFEIHTGKPLTLGKKPVRSVARHRLWSGESVGVSHAAYGNWRMLWCGCKSNACIFLYPNVLFLPRTPRTSSNEKPSVGCVVFRDLSGMRSGRSVGRSTTRRSTSVVVLSTKIMALVLLLRFLLQRHSSSKLQMGVESSHQAVRTSFLCFDIPDFCSVPSLS